LTRVQGPDAREENRRHDASISIRGNMVVILKGKRRKKNRETQGATQRPRGKGTARKRKTRLQHHSIDIKHKRVIECEKDVLL